MRPAPRLVLLNGAPGVGKSTLAQAWAARDPEHRRVVEVDLIKHALPDWPADPRSSGLRARELALDQARVLLVQGHAVVLPQFLARPEFADALAALAGQLTVRGDEVLLTLPSAELATRLTRRQAAPERPEHAENDRGVSPDDAAALVVALEAWAAERPHVRRVDARGGVDEVVARIEAALA